MAKYKEDYDKSCKKRFDSRRKRMVDSKPPEGFYSKALREYFKDLKNLPSSDPRFKRANEYARRAYEKYGNPDSQEDFEPSKKRFRSEGAGRKTHAPEFRNELFEWFIGKN